MVTVGLTLKLEISDTGIAVFSMVAERMDVYLTAWFQILSKSIGQILFLTTIRSPEAL